MRLGRVCVNGFRKIVDSDIAIIGNLIAVVGPNEAGKSSFLELLTLTSDGDPIPHLARPRGLDPDDDSNVVDLWFRLEDSDLELLKDIRSPERPLWYRLEKKYDGQQIGSVEPRMTRDTTARRRAQSTLERFARTKAAANLERSDEQDGIGDHLDFTIAQLDGADELSDSTIDRMRATATLLAAEDGLGKVAEAGTVQLHELTEELRDEHPNSLAFERLMERQPHFAMFDSAQRALASDYEIREAADDTPPALANLAHLARLDIQALALAVAQQDIGAIETITDAANERLREEFTAAWRQSRVIVRLRQDGATLRILVSNDDPGYSSIAERSDGLKSFVALTAFASRQNLGGRPLILLIDEAEQHLHLDAQADLIRVLERQEIASQVIYTTHSPGCLPSDMGTSIRPVVPISEHIGRSKIVTSFWGNSPGFNPLLMALGAAAAAFTPSRYAVLCEGPTEMVLLPSLIREATAMQRVPYQVAPGVAAVGNSDLLDLELEAPRVAYQGPGKVVK